MTQEALKLALEALEELNNTNSHWWQEVDRDTIDKIDPAITAIKKALEQEQEPVAHWSDCAVHNEPAYPKGECDCGGFNPTAWLVEDADGSHLYWTYKEPIGNEKWTPLFSTPPQRTEQEPWCMKMNDCKTKCEDCPDEPPQRTWVGLTDEEIAEIESEYIVDYRIPAGSAWNFAKDIEAKLKEKNT